MSKAENIELFFKEGGSDKVYKASLTEGPKGFSVNFAYGRRGNTLTTGCKTPEPLPYEKAKKIYDKIVLEKTAKGYTEAEGAKPYTGMVDVESRDTGIRPQLLNEIEEDEVEKYISDPAWCAQEKYDGRRRLALKNAEGVFGTNRKGLTIALSEDLTKEIAEARVGTHYVLDGEALGDVLMVFDYLAPGNYSYKERYKVLTTMKFGNLLKLAPVAWTTKEKRDLYARLKKDNAEGIVFKKIDGEYKPGRPNTGGDQLKFKFCATATCFVDKVNTSKRSVSLGVYDKKGKPVIVGNVTVYPNQEIPKAGTVVEVRYLYYFQGGSLFQPVLLGPREDADENDCSLGQLKIKREEEIES